MYRKRHSPDACQFQKARGHEALQTCSLVQHQLTSSKSTVDESHTSRSCAVGTSRRFPAIEMRESPRMSELTDAQNLPHPQKPVDLVQPVIAASVTPLDAPGSVVLKSHRESTRSTF